METKLKSSATGFSLDLNLGLNLGFNLGFSLIEVLIALSLFAFIICGASKLLMQTKHLESMMLAQEQKLQSILEQTEHVGLKD